MNGINDNMDKSPHKKYLVILIFFYNCKYIIILQVLLTKNNVYKQTDEPNFTFNKDE